MPTATSSDGTRIAYDQLGLGPPLILVAGGRAHLYGHSSGACLALLATAQLGKEIKTLTMYEPPYHIEADAQQRWGSYIARLTDALGDGCNGDAMASSSPTLERRPTRSTRCESHHSGRIWKPWPQQQR